MVGSGRGRRSAGAPAQGQARRTHWRSLRGSRRQDRPTGGRRRRSAGGGPLRQASRAARGESGAAEPQSRNPSRWRPRSSTTQPFDAILLDAPCSATGTIRRHPDVTWTKGEDDLRKLTALQTPPPRQGREPAETGRPSGLLHLFAGGGRGRASRRRRFSTGIRILHASRSRLRRSAVSAEWITPQGRFAHACRSISTGRRPIAAGSTGSSQRDLSAIYPDKNRSRLPDLNQTASRAS